MTGDRPPSLRSDTGSEIRCRMSDPYLPEVRSGSTGSEIRRYRKSLPPNTPDTYSLERPRGTLSRSRARRYAEIVENRRGT